MQAVPKNQERAERQRGDGHHRELADLRLHQETFWWGKDEETLGETSLEGKGITISMGGFPKGRHPLGDTAPAPALWGQELFWDRATRVPASPTPPRTSAASGDVPLGVLQPPEEKAAERLKSVSGRAPLFGRGRSFF